MSQQNQIKPIVQMRDINKSFGAIKALDGVNFHLMPGEIVGLVGDNSAGKSTLMKILSGAYTRDSGEIYMEAERSISTTRMTAVTGASR